MKEGDEDTQWRERLAALPRDRAPRRDLWPEIEARISADQAAQHARRPPYRRWPMAVAALVVVSVIAYALVDRGGQGAARPAGSESAAQIRAPGYASALEVTEREYRAALREFQGLPGEPGGSGKPMGAHLQPGWAIIAEAESELNAALRRYPHDPYINERLVQLRTRQLKMLRQYASAGMASRGHTI